MGKPKNMELYGNGFADSILLLLLKNIISKHENILPFADAARWFDIAPSTFGYHVSKKLDLLANYHISIVNLPNHTNYRGFQIDLDQAIQLMENLRERD